MAEFRTELSADGEFITIEIADGDKVLATFEMDALDLSAFIERLGAYREQMAEPVTPMYDHGARMAAIPDPEWVTNPGQDRHPGRVWMSIRHPGYGWLPFLLREDQASRLGTSLVRGGW